MMNGLVPACYNSESSWSFHQMRPDSKDQTLLGWRKYPSLHVLCLSNEAWTNGLNSLVLCLIGPTANSSYDSPIWWFTVRWPISSIQPYLALVLLVEYILPYILLVLRSIGLTIHWSYPPLAWRPIRSTDWMHASLVLRNIDPTP